MPRKKRIILPGFCYHVMLRGNGKQVIFREKSDQTRLCLFIQYAVEKHNFLVHGFCLMNNHIHLLLEPKNTDLSKGVHLFAFRYAQYFNRKYDLEGHLFQGRYKSIIVQHGLYLRCLIRYIHRNPIRANMVSSPEDYAWSSHAAYLGQTTYTWLTQDLILSLFTNEEQGKTSNIDRRKDLETYINMDNADAKDHLEAIRLSTRLGAYGNMEFVKAFGDDQNENVPLSSCLKDKKEIKLMDLLQVTCDHLGVCEKELHGPSRKTQIVNARAILAVLATNMKIATLSELASQLSRDHSSLSRLKQKAISENCLMQYADQIRSKLMNNAQCKARPLFV